jgi:histidine ammonia-lyase/two-component sensor histidine kinase
MILTPGHLTLPQLRRIARERVTLTLDPASRAVIDAGAKAVADIAAKGEPAYGINTGFGRLASTHIPHDQLELLQRNLVLSHAVGVGEPMSAPVVRLLIALKLSSLGRGHSGIRGEVMDALVTLVNADVLPIIPVKGSVGASGDLAPLAHMSAVLLGIGEVTAGGERMSATEGLRLAGLAPLALQAKEGLALLNGTQASTALALFNMFAIEDLFRTGLVAGALSVDAAAGSVKPFDARIHALRGHRGQIEAAAAYRALLDGSGINLSHRDCGKVQDPYSLRCQPQVMGACLDQMRHAAEVLLIEANAVSDNPLVFPDTGEVLSGGNFHAEPVAFAADNLALAAAEIGALAERMRKARDEAEAEVHASRDRYAALAAEREMLLREVNHRVGNSLQIIASLLHLQASSSNDDDVKAALMNAMGRVAAVAQVHRRLYTSHDLKSVMLNQYLEALLEDLRRSAEGNRMSRLTLSADPIEIDPDRAVGIGIIVNELVMNAVKYAYPDGAGPIHVDLHNRAQDIELVISDEGVGLQAKHDPRSTGMGQRIVSAMAIKLDASVERDPSHAGTRIVINFSPSGKPQSSTPA